MPPLIHTQHTILCRLQRTISAVVVSSPNRTSSNQRAARPPRDQTVAKSKITTSLDSINVECRHQERNMEISRCLFGCRPEPFLSMFLCASYCISIYVLRVLACFAFLPFISFCQPCVGGVLSVHGRPPCFRLPTCLLFPTFDHGRQRRERERKREEGHGYRRDAGIFAHRPVSLAAYSRYLRHLNTHTSHLPLLFFRFFFPFPQVQQVYAGSANPVPWYH